MACPSLVSSSSSLCLLPNDGTTSQHACCTRSSAAARALPSRQAVSFRNVGTTIPSNQLPELAVRASPSRSTTRVQAVEESTSSATGAAASVTEEVKGATEGGGGGGGGGGNCAGCGRAERVGGCNGEGRIQGGLGALPGFGWFPIKVFRPCPAFIETGGRYRRIGQSLEEVAFGRKGTEDDLDISDRLKGQK